MAAPTAKKPADVNKSAEIRKIATSMKAKGEKPRPSVIVVELKKQGITVCAAAGQQHPEKDGLPAAAQAEGCRQGQGWSRRQGQVGEGDRQGGAQRASIVSVEDLLAAKKAAGTIGGTDKAIAALQALKRFEG